MVSLSTIVVLTNHYEGEADDDKTTAKLNLDSSGSFVKALFKKICKLRANVSKYEDFRTTLIQFDKELLGSLLIATLDLSA
jgi:predicted metal-dependent peptidase